MIKKLLVSCLLIFSPLILNSDEFIIPDLKGGMNSFNDANTIDDNQASFVQNFYTDLKAIAEERNGYEKKDSTIIGGTKAVTGLWDFTSSAGDQWIIAFSSRTFWKNTVGNAPTSFGLSSTVDTVPDCTVNLGKIWCVNGTDDLWSFDGTSTANYSGAPVGRHVEAWRNRIVIGDVLSNRSSVYFSEDGDGTNWTVGSNPTDPFILKFGGANDGFNITGIWGSYLDNMIVFRRRDTWAISGFDQLDIRNRNISREIGCIQTGSIQEFDGSLIFLSLRGLEEMTGLRIRNISEPVRDLVDTVVKNTVDERTETQTTQSDWEAGTQSPDSWFQTDISPGSIQLGTATSTTDFTDTDQADFDAGTLTTVTSTQTAGQVALILSDEVAKDSLYNSDASEDKLCVSGIVSGVRSFSASSDYLATGVTVRLRYEGGTIRGEKQWVDIRDDDGGSPESGYDAYCFVTLTNGSTYDDYSCTFNTPKKLDSGTRYWINIGESGWNSCTDNPPTSEVDIVYWSHNSAPNLDATEYHCAGSGCTPSANGLYKYKMNGKSYNLSGNFLSQSFDVGADTGTWLWNWGLFSVTDSQSDSEVDIVYQTQTASSTTGSWETLQTATDSVIVPSTVQRYIRYKASFTSSDAGKTPTLSSVTIPTSDRIRPSGTYTTQVMDAGENISSWSTFLFNDTTDDNGTITYEFNASSQSALAYFNSSSWTSVVSGQIPSNGVERYFIVRSSVVMSNATGTATVESISVSWGEGDSPPVSSTVYDRRYWLAFTTNTTSSPNNDAVLLYQRNRTWSLFKGIDAGSFAYWRDNLYFGDADDSGLVYKFDTGDNDDGSDIASEIRFKSYDLGTFHRDKDFKNLYVGYLGNDGFTGSFSMLYEIERDGTERSLGSTNLNDYSGQTAGKFPFSLTDVNQGRELKYILRKSGQNSRLKLYNFLTEFDLKEAR